MLKRNIYLLYAIACLQGMVFYGPIATLYREARGISLLEIGLIESVSLALCLLLAMTQHAAVSVLGVLTLRISFGLLQPLQLEIWSRQVRGENRATALSAQSVVMSGVAVGTNILFGALAERNLPGAFGVGAILCVLGAALMCPEKTE